MTETTYKWGEAPGEFKSQKDAQRAKTQQKVKSRRMKRTLGRIRLSNPAHGSVRASIALSRTFKPTTVPGWGNIVKSITAQLRSMGGRSGVPVRGGGKQPHPWKTEIPKKLTRNY